jgi:transposase InsO family protein
VHRQHTTPYNP